MQKNSYLNGLSDRQLVKDENYMYRWLETVIKLYNLLLN
jgi:hypothetical protein